MKTWYRYVLRAGLLIGAGGLCAFEGCGLTDQQMASIWQSVIMTGLNTLVTNLLTAAAGGTGA